MGSTGSQDTKRLVQELGDTIQKTLAESPQIADCLHRIKAEGYDVSLVLEATIGFHRQAGNEPRESADVDFRLERSEPEPLKMTPLDKKFLRSLKISVEDED